MKDKISIIVPVYNVAPYVDKCIYSLLNQTYENFEVIIVNDGSTDNSVEIIKKIIGKDTRFIIYNKENGGISDARNYGIKRTTGNFVTFVDSDDYLDNDYLEYLYFLLKKYDADLSICSLYNVITKGSVKKIKRFGNDSEGVLSAKNTIEKMCYHNDVDTCAVAKLYKKELFDGVYYQIGKLFEDMGTTYKLFMKANKIAYGFSSKYYYNIRSNSIVTSKYNKSKLDLLEMTDEMAKNVIDVYPELLNAVSRRKLYARFATINQILGYEKENVEDFNKIKNYILYNSSSVFKNKKTPKRDKVAIVCFRVNYYLYVFMWKLYVYLFK